MSDYTGVVTTIGQTKIAAAIGGTALNLTTIRVGDGNGAPITPIPGMIDLVRRVGAAYAIVSSGRDPVNANHWRVTALIPAADGPFDIREIAVFDATGDMIAIAKHVFVEKRSPAQGAAVELLTDIVFPVSETAQVTVAIQPSAAISIFQMLRAGFTVVESATTAAPPGAPALGRTHVVPAGATGAWAGLAGYLVQWNGIVWVAVSVPIGFHVVDQSKAMDSGLRWIELTATGWKPGLSRLLQKQPGNLITAVGGTSAAITGTLDPPFAAHADLLGAPFIIRPPNVAVATPMISLNNAAQVPIRWADGTDVADEDWVANEFIRMIADATGFVLPGLSPTHIRRLVPGGTLYIFNSVGTFTWTPDKAKRTAVGEAWGSGGGAGGAVASQAFPASGGAGGAYVLGSFAVNGLPLTIIVPDGGQACIVGVQNATDGNTTSIGSVMTAGGGKKGNNGNNSAQATPAVGGVATGGQLRIPGESSGSHFLGLGNSYAASKGGNGPRGGAGGQPSTSAGADGQDPGGGGGGGGSGNNGSSLGGSGNGGKGGKGLALISC